MIGGLEVAAMAAVILYTYLYWEAVAADSDHRSQQ